MSEQPAPKQARPAARLLIRWSSTGAQARRRIARARLPAARRALSILGGLLLLIVAGTGRAAPAYQRRPRQRASVSAGALHHRIGCDRHGAEHHHAGHGPVLLWAGYPPPAHGDRRAWLRDDIDHRLPAAGTPRDAGRTADAARFAGAAQQPQPGHVERARPHRRDPHRADRSAIALAVVGESLSRTGGSVAGHFSRRGCLH